MQPLLSVAAQQQLATICAGDDQKGSFKRCVSVIPDVAGFLTFAIFVPCSCEDTVIPARGRKLVKTGIAIHTPPGTYGRVAPRSGLAVNHFIDVGAGVIDEDYRGEVRVLLFNHEAQDFQGVWRAGTAGRLQFSSSGGAATAACNVNPTTSQRNS